MFPELFGSHSLMINRELYKVMPPLSKFAVDPAAENSVVIPYVYVICNCYDLYNLMLFWIKNEGGGVHVKC